MKPKSRKSKPNIDWQKALDAWKCGHESGDQSEFLNMVIPFAKYYAGLKADRYRGSIIGIEVDYHECLSAALCGLMKIADKPSITKEGGQPNPELLRNLCATIISRKLIDVERKSLGRRRRKERTVSLDAAGSRNTERYLSMYKKLGYVDTEINRDEWLDYFLTKVRPDLTERQFNVLSTVATLGTQGYLIEEMAAEVGISQSAFANQVSIVRKKLHLTFPELEKELRVALQNFSRDNVRKL